MAVKKCSKCYAEFECGAEAHACWCKNISLDKKPLEELKKEFENCLCPDCLGSFEVKPVSRS